MKSLKQLTYLSAVALLTFSACSKDDDISEPGNSEPQQTTSGITMALVTTGGDNVEYIVNKEDIMTGEITADATGLEQIGWRFYYAVGKTLFSSGYSDDNQCSGFADNGVGVIGKSGSFIFENALEMFGESADDETFLAMEISRAGFAKSRLHFVDVNTVEVTKIIETTIFENKADSIIAGPGALLVRDGKLFIPFHKLHASGDFRTLSPDSAFIAVYSYPDMGTNPEKIIFDPRTSNIGVNAATTGLIKTDAGDIYSFSCGAEMAGFSPVATKPSGILRIKSGETEFDASYFFNIEEATNGGKIFWFDYVGDNKAIARILTHDDGGVWTAFGVEFNQKLVILDLAAKTVTDVANVPLHTHQFSSPILMDNGKAYVSIETATDAYVYQVDVASATGTKGAKIIGKTIKGFYKL
jgi:hypothetical protein